MKKWLSILLTIMLLMCACPALAATYSNSLFTVRYDGGRFGMDQFSYLESGNGEWFFILYDGVYSIDCGMERGNRGAGDLMADAQTLSAYAEAVCRATGGTLVESGVYGAQPFVIVAAHRPELGKVYYAETIVGGNAVYFEIYNLAAGTVDAAALSALKGILNGFSAK